MTALKLLDQFRLLRTTNIQ